jgi:hypothetical protein
LPSLEDFASQLDEQPLFRDRDADFIDAPYLKARKAALALYTAFIPLPRQVISDPFDEDRTPLIAHIF